MNEIHEAALAYYNNGTEEQRVMAASLFHVLDSDRSGRVSLEEYSNFLCGTAGLASLHPEMFRELDRNGDGELDFWEVMTIYYVAKTRTISCRTCQRCLIALYFTCVTCFESNCDETFDLCVGCYMKKGYRHEHRLFLDSFVLLRSRRNQNQKPSNVPQDITLQVNRKETKSSNVPQDTTLKVDRKETKPSNVTQDITFQVNCEETNPINVLQDVILQEYNQETNICNVPQDIILQEEPEESQEMVQNLCNVPQDTLPEEEVEETEEVEEINPFNILEGTIPQIEILELSDAFTALDVALTVVDVATSCSIM